MVEEETEYDDIMTCDHSYDRYTKHHSFSHHNVLIFAWTHLYVAVAVRME